MEIALYKNIKYGFETVKEITCFEDDSDYIRISDIAEVDFVALPSNEIISKEVDFINDSIQKEMADSQVRLNSLNQRKEELLAIGYENG